jgi:hypothetical protein
VRGFDTGIDDGNDHLGDAGAVLPRRSGVDQP